MTTFSPVSKKCDICTAPFPKSKGTRMYDTVVHGRWGCICHTCFVRFNCALGLGKGQKYERQVNGAFLLVEGGSGTYLKGTLE